MIEPGPAQAWPGARVHTAFDEASERDQRSESQLNGLINSTPLRKLLLPDSPSGSEGKRRQFRTAAFRRLNQNPSSANWRKPQAVTPRISFAEIERASGSGEICAVAISKVSNRPTPKSPDTTEERIGSEA